VNEKAGGMKHEEPAEPEQNQHQPDDEKHNKTPEAADGYGYNHRIVR